jgi:hypothetical protein
MIVLPAYLNSSVACASTFSPTFAFFESTDEFSCAFSVVPLGKPADGSVCAGALDAFGIAGV